MVSRIFTDNERLIKRCLFEGKRLFANKVRKHKMKRFDPYVDDEAFLRCFDIDVGDGANSLNGFLEHFRLRKYPRFYFDVRSDGGRIKEILFDDFKDEQERFFFAAQEIIEGKIHLLGTDFFAENGAFKWNFDPISKTLLPLDRRLKSKTLRYNDLKPVAELNRHTHFPMLAKAYFLAEDDRYFFSLMKQWENWMDENPPEKGIQWVESLDIAFRCISWIWALNLLLHSKLLKSRAFIRIIKFLCLQARYIYDNLSIFYSPNTHVTGEALALFLVAAWMPELKMGKEWQKKGKEILEEQIQLQIDKDGWYREQTTYYHCYTLDIYLQALIFAEINGIGLSPSIRQKIEKMTQFLMLISTPDGALPRVGDDDGGKIIRLGGHDYYSYKEAFSTGAVLFNRPDFKYVSRGFHEESLWLLGPDGFKTFNQIEARSPDIHSIAFKYAGIHVHRTDWSEKAQQLIFDCGDMGFHSSGHGHADLLSFQLFANGKAVIIDPGTFRYVSSGHWRNYFRGTSAHNTVTLDDTPQAQFGTPFKWITKANPLSSRFVSLKGLDFSAASHDGYTRLPSPIVHSRSIFFVKPLYWIINDNFNGNHDHAFTAHFHIDSDQVQWDAKMSRLTCDFLDIIPFFAQKPQVRMTRGQNHGHPKGWCAPVYGTKRPICAVDFSVIGSAPCEFMFLIFPQQNTKKKITVIKTGEALFTVLQIRHSFQTDILFLNTATPEPVGVNHGEFYFEGEMALIRFTHDQITELGGLNIKTIRHDGRQLCSFLTETSFWKDLRKPNEDK